MKLNTLAFPAIAAAGSIGGGMVTSQVLNHFSGGVPTTGMSWAAAAAPFVAGLAVSHFSDSMPARAAAVGLQIAGLLSAYGIVRGR